MKDLNLDVQVEVNPDICNNVDGCNDIWDVEYREAVVLRVFTELTENDNKDLFRLMEQNGIDIDDADDINIELSSVFKEGETK